MRKATRGCSPWSSGCHHLLQGVPCIFSLLSSSRLQAVVAVVLFASGSGTLDGTLLDSAEDTTHFVVFFPHEQFDIRVARARNWTTFLAENKLRPSSVAKRVVFSGRQDKEEVGEHLPTCTEMYRCATYAAEPRLRYSSTTHDPPHTNTSLSTQTHHDHNHSRRRREAAKSDRNQANTERAPQAAAKKSTADVKDNAKENRRKKTKRKGRRTRRKHHGVSHISSCRRK